MIVFQNCIPKSKVTHKIMSIKMMECMAQILQEVNKAVMRMQIKGDRSKPLLKRYGIPYQ